MIKTRFAPSPTGYLHIGGLRTALYAYLIAKKNNGKFVLRLEDTDRTRYVEGATETLMNSLYWAEIIPDEGLIFENNDAETKNIVQTNHSDKSYIQSERLDIYRIYIDKLIDNNHAYYCFCTSKRLEELRKVQQLNKSATGYDKHCREIDTKEAKERIKAGEKYTVRMKMPLEGATIFTDIIRGEISVKNILVDDQVILKSDGFPTYHLAVVVDDHLMGITHIIRGEEWLPSTPKHIQLYKYFGWEIPKIAHLPLILNPDKSKLSKRQGDVSVEDYIKKGYLKEALINFIVFLGWNPGDEREMFTLKELVNEFSLEKIGKSGAVFNIQKLDWYNKEYLKNMPADEIVNRASEYLISSGLVSDNDLKNTNKRMLLCNAIKLEQGRITTLTELPDAISFIFKLPNYDTSILTWEKSTIDELKNILPKLYNFLEKIDTTQWKNKFLETTVKKWITDNKYQVGTVLWPLRTSLSGQQNSPNPFEIAEVLAKEESLKRIKIAITRIE